MKKILVIAGQTCSGKSSLGLELAKILNGYIINGDSKQIYTEIPIATAQPIPDKIKKSGVWIIEGIEHYLYGFTEITSQYNAFKYKQDVLELFNLNKLKEKVPIIVGGTGLYIDTVVNNYFMEESLDSFSKNELDSLTLKQLQDLIGENLKLLNMSDRNNKRRLIRLLHGRKGGKDSNLNCLYIVTDQTKEEIEKRLEKRLNLMFDNGLTNEAQNLYKKYMRNLPTSLNIIGFKEFIPYFKGDIDLDTVKKRILIHSRQYAKRQRTWFRKNKNAIYSSNIKTIIKLYNE